MNPGAVLIADERKNRDDRDHGRCSKLNAVLVDQSAKFRFNRAVIDLFTAATVSPLCERANKVIVISAKMTHQIK